MLRLSKKSDYALIALKDLALSAPGTSSSAREIAGRYEIPTELMAKVLQRLAKIGLVASHQGTRGGYILARPASQISVADVIQAIDGPVTLVACSEGDETCDQYSKCTIRDPLWRLKDRIVRYLTALTIHELAYDKALEPFPITISSPEPDSLEAVAQPVDH